MRAMIMAAGIGSRLRPVTDLLPKPMAPIVNRPALYHILRLLGRHGIREVVINLHHLPESIRDYLGTGDRLDMEVTYSFEEELLGTAGGVKSNEEFLGGETFLVMSGDALTDVDLTAIKIMYVGTGDPTSSQPGGSGLVRIDDIELHRSPGQ